MDNNDCGATKTDFRELREEFRTESLVIRDSIDRVKATKYTPFFGAMALFVVIWGALWNSIRSVENEIDKVHIAVALATSEAQQFRFGRTEDQARHRIEHRRERERVDRIVEFIKNEYGFTVKMGEPKSE